MEAFFAYLTVAGLIFFTEGESEEERVHLVGGRERKRNLWGLKSNYREYRGSV